MTCCEEVYEKKKKLLNLLVLIHIPKSLGLGLVFEEAKATSGQAKAGAFRPSQVGTALVAPSSKMKKSVAWQPVFVATGFPHNTP